jgi:hypothetical protein
VSVRGASAGADALRTKPWKKKLIQLMISICGTIMTCEQGERVCVCGALGGAARTICVFIPAIIPSMAAGSESGLGARAGASPLGGPSLRNTPAANERARSCEIAL